MSSNQHPNRASPSNQNPLSPAQAADLQQRAIAQATIADLLPAAFLLNQ